MIISVSRRTDVPNYFADWFFKRIEEGYLLVRNPINTHMVSKIDLSPAVVDCIVFWTKNPKPMLDRLDLLDKYSYYFQFTLTGYGKDVEPNIPDKLTEVIPTFKRLSERIGKEKVIWRYDPILVNSKYTVEYHEHAFGRIAESLSDYTEKVVISFVDLYAKTKRNTSALKLDPQSAESMLDVAGRFSRIAREHGLIIETCSESVDLSALGIKHGSCVDKDLIERILGRKIKCAKDSGQRKECGCFESIDVGSYNTCSNACKYCYANFDTAAVSKNVAAYDVDSPMLCDNLRDGDKVYDRKMRSLKIGQMNFWD